MSVLEFPEPTSESTFDVYVEAEFEADLGPEEITKVLFAISDTLRDKLGSHLFDGISSLEVNRKKVKILFMFKNKKVLDMALFKDRDSSMLRMQFIFYLFAKIDQISTLGEVPFPPDFRVYIDLPESLGLELS